MGTYFNDPNSVLIFVVGVLVRTFFIIGVWELMRQEVTGMPGRYSTKDKRTENDESI
tara:strand:+ start:310 stop:480 length:171 start_codon:yes stop_codon:yes gene_type:complete